MEICIRSTEYVFQEHIQLGYGKVYLVHSKEYLTLFGHVHRSCGICTEYNIKWLETEADKT